MVVTRPSLDSVSTAVDAESVDLTVPSLKCAVGGGDGGDGEGSSGVGPNAERAGDTACERFCSADETLPGAAIECPLSIVGTADKADGRDDAEPVEYDWSRREAGVELEVRTPSCE